MLQTIRPSKNAPCTTLYANALHNIMAHYSIYCLENRGVYIGIVRLIIGTGRNILLSCSWSWIRERDSLTNIYMYEAPMHHNFIRHVKSHICVWNHNVAILFLKDLVKNHLMFAVREEIKIMNDEIQELMAKNEELELENRFLRSFAKPETLARLDQFNYSDIRWPT